MRFPTAEGFLDPFHIFRAVGRFAATTLAMSLVAALRSEGPKQCAALIEKMMHDKDAPESALKVSLPLRCRLCRIRRERVGVPCLRLTEGLSGRVCATRPPAGP